ncbi:MAG TPA: fibronectin type III domain-containing protein [Planctomycetota bacterium]|nr:fibronectin type III domain-containing protein [Planctomycetota bacterium]
MMEWVLLLVLVPAIVIPVVLLFGFAGCDLIFTLDDAGTAPINLTAQAESRSAIKLAWEYTGMDPVRFEVQRKRSVDATFEVVTPPQLLVTEFTDTGLDEGTSYDFQLASVQLSGGLRSAPVPATAATLGKAFETTLPQEAPGANRCVVQRIEPARLSQSGTRVQITLQRPAGGPLLINRLSISHAAAAGDPYDSDGAPTMVVDIGAPLFIAADPTKGLLELPVVDFALDQTRPLLVAFDTGLQGQLPLLTGVSLSEATTFASPPGLQQAAVADRQAGYTPVGGITLVQRIDAG